MSTCDSRKSALYKQSCYRKETREMTISLTHLLPSQLISPLSSSTTMLSSGTLVLTIAANPVGVASPFFCCGDCGPSVSCMPTKVAPGNSRQDVKGGVRWGTYGAHRSKGKRRDFRSSQQSSRRDCLVEISITCHDKNKRA